MGGSNKRARSVQRRARRNVSLLERDHENAVSSPDQNDLGIFRAWVATWLRIRFVLIGATW